MSTAKVRCPAGRKGELRLQWGYDPDSRGKTLVTVWGGGVSMSDVRWLSKRVMEKRCTGLEVEPSFVAELEARGFDTETLVISVFKRAEPGNKED